MLLLQMLSKQEIALTVRVQEFVQRGDLWLGKLKAVGSLNSFWFGGQRGR